MRKSERATRRKRKKMRNLRKRKRKLIAAVEVIRTLMTKEVAVAASQASLLANYLRSKRVSKDQVRSMLNQKVKI